MKKFLLMFLIFSISIAQTYAYAVRVYDEYGNRIGTYRKEGDDYVMYDFYDRKIDNPSDLIKNAPSQRTLTEYSQYFYDENMRPIGSYTSGFFSNTGRYYSRGFYVPSSFYPMRHRAIVRPSANGLYPNAKFDTKPKQKTITGISGKQENNGTYYIKTGSGLNYKTGTGFSY